MKATLVLLGMSLGMVALAPLAAAHTYLGAYANGDACPTEVYVTEPSNFHYGVKAGGFGACVHAFYDTRDVSPGLCTDFVSVAC